MTSGKLNLELVHAGPQPGGAGRRLTERFGLWLERVRQRDALSHLDSLALRDLGLSEADIWREAGKPPWQA